MTKRCFISAATLAASVIAIWGAPSRQRPLTVTDAAGHAVTVVAVGDEHSRRYISLADGTPVKWIGSEGSAKSFIPMARLSSEGGAMRAKRKITTFPTLGENRFLVILVEFADKSFSIDDPQAEMEAMFNAPGYNTLGGTGSVRDYYSGCSDGKFKPVFDVVGPVRMQQNVAYYGGGSDDSRAGLMVIEACRAVDSEIDFSLYDHDGNGEVDSVYFIYAGKGEADGGAPETIWPHSWNLSDQGRELTLDGVAVQGYACSPELDGSAKLNGMGTPCHEFAHVLGLPDLYCTNSYVECLHPSDFSLMARGNYLNDGRTPPALSAYERYELGWLSPRALTHPATVTLHPLSGVNEACRISTERTNEYFLLENRQRTGWDTYLPAHGMLVWHIDYSPDIWDRNRVNANPSHQYVDIVEANNATSFNQAAGFTFPGTGNVTSFTATTRPALVSWSGQAIDLPLTGITENADGTVTFDVAGGKEPVGRPDGLQAFDVAMTGFSVKWNPAPAATGHTLRLVETDEDGREIASPVETEAAQGASTHTFTDLLPGKIYSVSVRGNDMYESGLWSEPLSVRMPDPTFEYLRPVALTPEEVGRDSFTALWQPLDGAVRYHVTVVPRVRGTESYERVDFTGKTLPDGYLTTSTVWVSMAGNYGASAPALRLGNDGDSFTSPLNPIPASSIEFWIKAQNPDPEALIIVEEIAATSTSYDSYNSYNSYDSYNSPEARLIASFTPQAEATTVRFENNLPPSEDDTALRIRFVKAGKCTVNIDDVVIGYGGSPRDDTANATLHTAEGSTTTSLAIGGLKEETLHAFTVRGEAPDGTLSLPSAPVEFTTSRFSALTAPGIYLQGTPDSPAAETPVDIYSTTGMLLLRGVTPAEARRLLPPGLYIAGSTLISL